MISNNDKIAKEIVTIELLDIRRFHVDVKDIKNPIKLWEKHEFIFLVVCLLIKYILKIVGFQIEIECIFSLARFLTSLKRCQLEFWIFYKKIVVN